MIAEAVELSTATIGVTAVGALLLLAMSIGVAWGTIRTELRALTKAVNKHERSDDDHHVEADARFADHGQRISRLEIVAELTPIEGIPRPATGPHPRLRSPTPDPRLQRRVRESSDTHGGSDESR